MQHTEACRASYFADLWAADPDALHSSLELLRVLGPEAWSTHGAAEADGRVRGWSALLDAPIHRLSGVAAAESASRSKNDRLYSLLHGGIASIPLVGPLKKGASKTGTNTLEARRAIRQAVSDDVVKSIVLLVDSPGGQVHGVHELAEDVRIAGERKRLVAHIDDLGASAALWAIAGAPRITANFPARVGSIGAYSVLYDQTKSFEDQGIKVHVVSTGPFKAAGVPGTPITDEVVAYVREGVEAFRDLFRNALARGRRLSDEQLDELSSGRTWPAPQAAGLGLVDAVQPLDATIAELVAAGAASSPRGASTRLTEQRLRTEAEAIV